MSNSGFFDLARDRVRGSAAELAGKWGWYFALGVFLTILGFIAAGTAVTATMLSVVVLGWILVAAGAALVILSFLTGRWSGFLLSLAVGVLSLVGGIEMISYPVSGAVVVTMIIGMILLVAGSFRAVASIAMRFPNWGWALVSGIVAFVLGVMLLSGWQNMTLWFLGFAVGIELILHGVSWMAFSLGLHRLGRELGMTEEDRRAA